MGFFSRFLLFWRKKETAKEEPVQETPKSFFLYIVKVPEILTYLRRERGISRRKLELVLVDNEEEPAWKIEQIIELVLPDLNLLYLVTGRGEAFEELTERALAEYGLLIVLLKEAPGQKALGNLLLDLNDWEKHLDIISAVRYNTLIQ